MNFLRKKLIWTIVLTIICKLLEEIDKLLKKFVQKIGID